MPRLIDADGIDEKYKEIKTGNGFSADEEISAKDALYFLNLAIDAMPTVKPKKGKWVYHPTDKEWDVCSCCGTGTKRREYKGMTICYKYCPWCGADMRGETDD